MAFTPEEVTDRLIHAKVQHELSRTKQLTIGTLLVLIAGNAGAIFGLKGCIQDAAVLAAKDAALVRVEKDGGLVQESIKRLQVRTETQASDVTRLETRTSGFGERVTSLDRRVTQFVGKLTDHESRLNAASQRVQDTNEELKKLQLVDELSDDQRGMLAELVRQVQSPEAQTIAELLGSRVDAVRLPIGTILPWHKHINTKSGKPVKRPPLGWVECNGPMNQSDPSYIKNSDIDLSRIPNLNDKSNDPLKGYNGGRFLRGGLTSGEWQPASSHLRSNAEGRIPHGGRLMHNEDGTRVKKMRRIHVPTGTDEGELNESYGYSRPANMSVVWIIRVK